MYATIVYLSTINDCISLSAMDDEIIITTADNNITL